MTWKEIVSTKEGTILKDWFDDGVRCLIMRGPASLCAYLGIPADHPLADFDSDALPVECHGGLTFSGKGKKGFYPEGWYWYGFDYAHSGDYNTYYDGDLLSGRFDHSTDKKWLVEDVEKDMWDAIYSFKKLIRLAETIDSRAKKAKAVTA